MSLSSSTLDRDILSRASLSASTLSQGRDPPITGAHSQGILVHEHLVQGALVKGVCGKNLLSRVLAARVSQSSERGLCFRVPVAKVSLVVTTLKSEHHV